MSSKANQSEALITDPFQDSMRRPFAVAGRPDNTEQAVHVILSVSAQLASM